MDSSWYSASLTELLLNLCSYRYNRAAPQTPPNASSQKVEATEAHTLRLEALTHLPPTATLLPGSVLAPCNEAWHRCFGSTSLHRAHFTACHISAEDSRLKHVHSVMCHPASTIRAWCYLQHVPFAAGQRDRRRLIHSHGAQLLPLLLLPCKPSLISISAILHHICRTMAHLEGAPGTCRTIESTLQPDDRGSPCPTAHSEGESSPVQVHTANACPFYTFLLAAVCRLPAGQPGLKHLACPFENRCHPCLHTKCCGSHSAARLHADPSAGHSHSLRQLWLSELTH